MRWRRSRTCPGTACAWAAWTATRRSSRASVAACWTTALGDRVALRGTADRSRARPQLRRRGPDGAGVACRDLRHGRHRGAGPWPAGHRDRGRRGDGGPRSRRRRDPAGAARRAGGPRRSRRRAPGLARRRRAEGAVAPGRRASGASRFRVVDHRIGRSQASWPGRRDDRRGRPGQRGNGLPCASPPTPRPAHATSPNASRRELPATGRWVIHDLGCGTGAMGRWLAPLLPGPQHWVLHDRDADLLELAAADVPGPAADGAAVTVEARRSDITRLRPGDLAGATLITASALLDMLTEEELAGLVTVCAGAGCPILLTLSVVGRVSLTPADPLDRRVAAAFDAHQRRATERGRLLGPDAVAFAVERVRPAGRRGARPAQPVATRRLAGRPGGGVVHRVGGCRVRAAAPSWPPRPRSIRADVWRRQRAGQLAVTVDHADLLVLPARTADLTPLTAGRRACARPVAPWSPDSGRWRRTGARPSAPARSRSPRTGAAAGPCPGCC